jgi:hypothetical protein
MAKEEQENKNVVIGLHLRANSKKSYSTGLKIGRYQVSQQSGFESHLKLLQHQ